MRPSSRGFTLIELMVVIALMALGTAGVTFALRDSSSTQLEREGQRLAALLEAARAQSRASGVPVRWQPVGSGFRFDGLPGAPLPNEWLSPDISAVISRPVVLGPDPILAPAEIQLVAKNGAAGAQRARVSTDGMRPFRVEMGP